MAGGADDVARGRRLLLATRDNRVADVAYLLGAGVSPHWQSWHNATPLYLAAMLGHAAIAQLLVRAEANVSQTPLASIPPTVFLTHEERETLHADWTANAHYGGPTPLFVAAQNGHVDVVEVLLTGKAMAARHVQIDVVQQLIAATATVNLANCDGVTPLYVAVEKRHEMIVDLLLASGADTNGVRQNSTTALYCAAQLGLLSVVQKLVVGGANIGHVAAYNATARLTALVHEHYDVVAAVDHVRRCYLDSTSVEQRGAPKQVPALHLAVGRGQTALIASRLMEESTVVHAQDVYDFMWRRGRIKQRSRRSCSTLLCQDVDGNTPLHLAAIFGRGPVIDQLVKKAPDAMDVINQDGWTAMAIAARNGRTDLVERFLQHRRP